MIYEIIIPILFIVVFIIYKIKLAVKIKENFKNLKKNELVIILPVRDREDNIKDYLENMIPIFNYQNIDYKIFIIEQSERKKFNKGKINNIGFIEAIKDNENYNRFLFNDIDNYPLKRKIINYNTNIKGIHHLFGNPKWLGGFFMTDKKTFEKINGYSNNFWGWGGEDNDLQNRIKIKKIKIDRSVFFKRDRKNNNLIKDDYNTKDKNINFGKIINLNKKKYNNNINSINQDGISTCKYKILKKYNMNNNPNIIRILVNI
jgi:hypothetical protein